MLLANQTRGAWQEVGRKRWMGSEVGLKNRWYVRLVGGGLSKLVKGGRLAPKTHGRLEVGPEIGGTWEVEVSATPLSNSSVRMSNVATIPRDVAINTYV